MFGGVAGHAGLFSNAYDIAVIMQMLLNKGVINGRRFISDTALG
jgi:CubicO group peptidase (beta-lactamase class C family)